MQTGANIKKIAKIFYVISVVFTILTAIGGVIAAVVATDGEIAVIIASLFGAAVVVGLGIFFAWIMKTFIMGYGELVENSAAIRENTTPKA